MPGRPVTRARDAPRRAGIRRRPRCAGSTCSDRRAGESRAGRRGDDSAGTARPARRAAHGRGARGSWPASRSHHIVGAHGYNEMAMRRLRIGLGQINPTVGDFEGNVAKILEGIARARELQCAIVAFPELAIPGYPPEDLVFKPAFIEANLRALAEIERASHGLTVVVGFIDRRDDIYNSAAVLHDGARAGVYDKQYLPNYGVFDENRYFQAGKEAPIWQIG